jgi:hypothetical protein
MCWSGGKPIKMPLTPLDGCVLVDFTNSCGNDNIFIGNNRAVKDSTQSQDGLLVEE